VGSKLVCVAGGRKKGGATCVKRRKGTAEFLRVPEKDQTTNRGKQDTVAP